MSISVCPFLRSSSSLADVVNGIDDDDDDDGDDDDDDDNDDDDDETGRIGVPRRKTPTSLSLSLSLAGMLEQHQRPAFIGLHLFVGFFVCLSGRRPNSAAATPRSAYRNSSRDVSSEIGVSRLTSMQKKNIEIF